jgi:hypothetical protein
LVKNYHFTPHAIAFRFSGGLTKKLSGLGTEHFIINKEKYDWNLGIIQITRRTQYPKIHAIEVLIAAQHK